MEKFGVFVGCGDGALCGWWIMNHQVSLALGGPILAGNLRYLFLESDTCTDRTF
jgi:hypothetical protein